MREADIDKNKPRSFTKIFKKLFSILSKKHKQQFWLLLVFMLIVSTAATFSAGCIALFAAAFASPERILDSKYIIMVQDVLPVDFLRTPKGIMLALSIAMVFSVALKNILECVSYYWTALYGAAIEANFGHVLFNGFLHMPYEWHLNRNSADILLAIQWRTYIGRSCFNAVIKIMGDVLQVLFLLVAIFVASPLISVSVFLLSGMIALVIYSKIHYWQEIEAEKCSNRFHSINRQTTKGIHGIKDIKVSGKTSFIKDFDDDAFQLARIMGMRSFISKLPVALLEIIGFGILAGAIIFMLFFTNASSVKVTTIISLLVVASWRILPAISRILTASMSIRGILPYAELEMNYINEIEASAVYPPESDTDTALDFNDKVIFKDISFAYQSRKANVLEDINFQIEKGKTIGIVGCSGVGKSTLVDIMIGLLVPKQGSIIVDGVELDQVNRYAWMKKLSYVPQTPYIIDGSIAENIAFGFGKDEIDRNFVMKCCKMAYMDDILESLPEGIDTIIGERGMRLSGGQRQRVAIARALYTKPEIMIFDEATSSLDSRSEGAIQETIGSLKKMKTLVIVAHRLQTVENCDVLIWIEAGKIKRIDTPKSILPEYEESLR